MAAGRCRLLAAATVLALAPWIAGCGWEPVYANREDRPATAALQAISVNPIPERTGQQLEMGLRNAFNPTGAPVKQRYRLTVSLETSLYSTGIQSQGLGTRGEVHITARYSLTDLATNKTVQTGFVHSSDAFDIQANGYSTVVAQDDAARRDIEEIRREIVARLTLFMEGKEPVAS
ncbi:MAG TPA: LPS assembly lipoprotein LptE [Stellaceae bacterium]|nr:LPS assembly lipoprotein LptE [Stellaceae bacterium]